MGSGRTWLVVGHLFLPLASHRSMLVRSYLSRRWRVRGGVAARNMQRPRDRRGKAPGHTVLGNGAGRHGRGEQWHARGPATAGQGMREAGTTAPTHVWPVDSTTGSRMMCMAMGQTKCGGAAASTSARICCLVPVAGRRAWAGSRKPRAAACRAAHPETKCRPDPKPGPDPQGSGAAQGSLPAPRTIALGLGSSDVCVAIPAGEGVRARRSHMPTQPTSQGVRDIGAGGAKQRGGSTRARREGCASAPPGPNSGTVEAHPPPLSCWHRGHATRSPHLHHPAPCQGCVSIGCLKQLLKQLLGSWMSKGGSARLASQLRGGALPQDTPHNQSRWHAGVGRDTEQAPETCNNSHQTA